MFTMFTRRPIHPVLQILLQYRYTVCVYLLISNKKVPKWELVA